MCSSVCIFCRGDAVDDHVEHILPESLGGGDWACLPVGLVCKGCNQYFGTKVERIALGSFPFLPWRLLLALPTKKGNPPSTQTHLGVLRASPWPGVVGIDPVSDPIMEKIQDGSITRLTILAEVTEPRAVCQFLLKMGLEVLAQDDVELALSQRFDAARRTARSPVMGSQWWFTLHIDHASFFARSRAGLCMADWIGEVRLETVEVEGAEVFHLRLPDIDLLTPLETRVLPPSMDNLVEPDNRLVRVTFQKTPSKM